MNGIFGQQAIAANGDIYPSLGTHPLQIAGKGLIDDVRIYNAAISTSQVRENYLAGLNKLLANNAITKTEYDSRISELNPSFAPAERSLSLVAPERSGSEERQNIDQH